VRSFATRLAFGQTLIAALLLAVLFLFTFFLTRRFLWQGLRVAAGAEYVRLVEACGPDFNTLAPADMTTRLRQISPTIPAQFYVEFTFPRDQSRLYATPNIRRHSLVDASRTDNVYLITIPGQGEFYVQTFPGAAMTIRIAQDLATAQIILDAYARASVLLFVAVLALNGFQVWLGARQALRPVRAMQVAAERISSENLGERIAAGPGDDEITSLAALLNRTFDRLQASFEQARRFTADASHELKTPLTVARAQAEKLLRPDLAPAQREEAAHSVLAELTQLEHIIEDLLLLARSDSQALPFAPRKIDPAEFWAEVLPEVQALAEYHQFRLDFSTAPEGPVVVDRRWMRHVVLNLVNNSIRHSPKDSRLTLTSAVRDGRWRVVVEDEGPGLPPENLEKIFGRFYQVRPDHGQAMEGTGLGLAICRSLVQLHRGTIAAENRVPGPGLRVVVDLPA
jgi:two-component system heavy metal sensor histidine kinase CusS